MAPTRRTAASLAPSSRLLSKRTASREPAGYGPRISRATAAASLFTIIAIVCIVSADGGYSATSWGWSAIALLGAVTLWAIVDGRTDVGRLDAVFLLALVLSTAWVGLSISWSIDHAQSVQELERWLVPLSGTAAFLLLARRGALRPLTASLVVAITSVGLYSLGTRLLPDQLGSPVASGGYRLAAPVGYWNALGIFVVIGILLALGIATDADAGRGTRAIGGGALAVLPLVLYFTFSRGSWAALAAGVVVMTAASSSRLRLVAETGVLALIPGLILVLASSSHALTAQNASPSVASHEGHRVGAILIALGALSTLAPWLLARLEPRIRLTTTSRRRLGGVLIAVLVATAVGAILTTGGPVGIAERGYDSFVRAAPADDPTDLNNRLLTINGNGRAQLWRVALNADDGHWLGGTGAGSFERNWDRSKTADFAVRDAHNLYVETLSELGIVGLVLLALLLGTPLVAGLRSRATPLVPAAMGAYGAFLVHNTIDWDWELSGIALTGLLAGSLLLVAGRRGPERRIARSARSAGLVGALAAAGFALIAAVGNGALGHARAATLQHRYTAAQSQARLAHRWMPWSPDPLLALGEAQLESGDAGGATASFRHAVSIDPRSWQAWIDLAESTQGATRKRAIAKARSLYPKSPEIDSFENMLVYGS
jgi:hypothetical protein